MGIFGNSSSAALEADIGNFIIQLRLIVRETSLSFPFCATRMIHEPVNRKAIKNTALNLIFAITNCTIHL